ncbi:MAG: mechanosensitive ion channel family protein [Acidimicrobiia bacterium]
MRLVIAVDTEALTETTIDPWNAVIAVAVAIVGWILSRVTRKAMTRVLAPLEGISEELRDLAARVAGYVVLFTGFGIALSILGVPIQPLLVAAIVIGVVLALVLRGIADNFAAGIVLQTRRPIEVGDEVDSLGYVGNVVEMNGRAVVVETFDGRQAHLPNSEVLGNPLINHSTKGARRSEVEVRVRSRDFDGTREHLTAMVAAVSGVLAEPAPAVYLTSIDPVRVTALVHVWHDPDNGLKVRSDVIDALAVAERDRTVMATVVTPQPSAPLTPSPWI